MFTWICPKCGAEVPPAYSECPNCAAKEAPSAATAAPIPPEAQAQPSPQAPSRPAAVEAPSAPAAGPSATAGRRMSGWLVTVLAAAGFAGVFAGVYWAVSAAQQSAQSANPPTQALETPVPATPAAVSANPNLKYVELTGLRLTEDSQQKAFLEFVAVNHSAADLGEVSARVNLKAAGSKEEEPVGTFVFKTSLGPYESKDLKVPVETKLRVYELPDWQFLRVEIAQ